MAAVPLRKPPNMVVFRQRRYATRRRLVTRRTAVRRVRPPTTRRRARVVAPARPIAQRVRTLEKKVRGVTERDTYRDVVSSARLPNETGSSVQIWNLSNINAWTRIFGTNSTVDLESKSHVYWSTFTLQVRADLNGAANGEHKLSCFLVTLTRAGYARHPGGFQTMTLTLNDDYTSTQVNASIMLNPDFFRVHRAWNWTLIKSLTDGATSANAVTDGSEYYKERMFRLWPKCTLKQTDIGWKVMEARELPPAKQYGLMVFPSAITTSGLITAPTFSWLQVHKLSSAN